MTAAIACTDLSKRYRRRWALSDCRVEIPRGRVAALVGPNGAGKTTLLHLAAGLLEPTSGSVRVLDRIPRLDPGLLPMIGFVAQDVPLYRSFTVGDMVEFGRRLNERWNGDVARRRLESLDIRIGARVGELSGGQRAQLALALVLAKQPEVLLLDEPLASLDPLARREFLRTLMEGVADEGTTVLLSSHLITDLERVCDYLILLSASRTQVAGEIDELLVTHRVITGLHVEGDHVAGVASVVWRSDTDRQTTMLVRTEAPILDPSWSVEEIGLEDLVLGYLGRPDATALPPPQRSRVRGEIAR
jgi:ABC-2 type transport system ATP-binding protein